MALVKVDPNQTKTVVALVIVLAAAVAFTFVRVSSSQQAVPAAAEAAPVESQPAQAARTGTVAYDHTRDPFKKPAGVAAAQSDASESEADACGTSVSLSEVSADTQQNPYQLSIGPIPAAGVPSGGAPPKDEGVGPRARKDSPEFTLLATVKNSRGYCAVIRSEASRVSVVEVGDTLDGFEVMRISGSHAVLTDGRDTVIAQRPRS